MTDSTATLVMREVVMGAIATVLVPVSKNKHNGNENDITNNKKRHTGWSPTVSTLVGADVTTAASIIPRRQQFEQE